MKNNIIDMNLSESKFYFSNALHENGYVILINHPIKISLIEKTYSEWKNFFSSESKFEYLRSKSDGEGYVPNNIENAKDFSKPDIKEFYHFYDWGRKPKSIDTKSTLDLYYSFVNLGNILIHWLDETMPCNIFNSLSMPLKEMISNSTRHLLRILHYPPIHQNFSSIRSAPHTDINLLTMLPISTSPGLEIFDNNNWQKIHIEKDAIIVTCADMLETCTSGYYPSLLHRVINPINEKLNISRYSMPFFIHPRPEVELKNGLIASDLWITRLKEIGLYYDYLCIESI